MTDCISLQSINSIKHQKRGHLGFDVFLVILSNGPIILSPFPKCDCLPLKIRLLLHFFCPKFTV